MMMKKILQITFRDIKKPFSKYLDYRLYITSFNNKIIYLLLPLYGFHNKDIRDADKNHDHKASSRFGKQNVQNAKDYLMH